jgi:hypothetical protein
VLTGLAGVVALAVSSMLLLNPWTAADTLGPVVAVAATRDVISGVDVSATVHDDDDQLSVRLTASGLGPGGYQLYAVTDGGEDLLLGLLSGAPGKNTYAGDVAIPAGDLWYFSLEQVDGPLIIPVTVTRGAPGAK